MKTLFYIRADQTDSVNTKLTAADGTIDTERTYVGTHHALQDGTPLRAWRVMANVDSTTGEGGVWAEAWQGIPELGESSISKLDLGAPVAPDADYCLPAVTDNGSARDIYPFPDADHATATVDAPTAAPVLHHSAAATGLLAGVFYVGYTYVQGDTGQTVSSPLASVTIDAGDNITADAITLPTNVTAVNWFMSRVANSTTLRHKLQNNGSAPTFTTLPVDFVFADPDVPRNLTATAGGVGDDIKAIQPKPWGKNSDGILISESLPAFTVNTAGIVTGSKAFKNVTRYQIPAMDGTGATTTLGIGGKLGLKRKLVENQVLGCFFAGAKEASFTLAFDSAALESNTIVPATTLDGSTVTVDVYDYSLAVN